MKFVDPIARVGEKILAYRSSIVAVEVQSLAPVRGVAVREIGVGKAFKIVAVGAEMVVDHIQNDAHAAGMGVIHKTTKIIWCPVETRRGKEIDAVIAPAEAAREICHGHDFNHR